MRRKIRVFFSSGRDVIIDRLKKVWDFLSKYTTIQVIMLIASLLAIALLVYGEPFFAQFALYIFLSIFTLCAYFIQTKGDYSVTLQKPKITTHWGLFLSTAFILPVYLMLTHSEFWYSHWRFISLVALTFPALLFIRRTWPETWRDNRWLILPAALIALWWINSTWIVTYETSKKWKVQEIHPAPLHSDSLRIAYPRQIPLDQPGNNILKIWCDDTVDKNCGNRRVILNSADDSVLFSMDTEPPIWKSKLPVQLNPRGKEQVILLIRNPAEENNQVSLGVQDNNVNKHFGTITFESESEAQARNFWLTLLQGGSIAITVITAIFAGLKQWDEQRRKDEKELLKELISKLRAVDNKESEKIAQLTIEIYEKLDMIAAWGPRSKKEIQFAFEKWITELCDKEENLAENWHTKVSDRQTNEFKDQGLVILNSFAINSSPYEGLLEKIKQASPSYIQSNKAVRYP
jgi:hypothetical protein